MNDVEDQEKENDDAIDPKKLAKIEREKKDLLASLAGKNRGQVSY